MIQRALTRLYQRHGVAGLLFAAAAGVITTNALALVLVFVISMRYMDASWGRTLPYLILGEGMMVAGFVIGIGASRASLRALLSWPGAGRTEARAIEAWRLAVATPRLLVTRAYIAIYIGYVITGVLWLAEFDQPGWVNAPEHIANGLLMIATAVFVMLGFEFLLRPAMHDIAAHLPRDFERTTSTLSLRAKAIVPIPGAIVFTVAVTGGLVDTTATYGARITIALIIALVAAVVAGALFLLAAHAALDPIDQLIDATERVREGDITTPVPVLTADELGTLARSFNQMLAGLGERETLREHNTELLEDVRASRARIVATADAERRRMERDLHDGAQQRLVLIKLKLAMATELVESDPKSAAHLLAELRSDAERAVDELRDLAHGIYPPLLESDGLAGALEDVANHASLSVTIDSDGTGRYPSQVEAAVYFCCLEALQNATKHAGAGSSVRIHLGEDEGHLRFTVADDGRGFDPAHTNGSVGLQNMTDRIGALGGTVHIDSAPGQGTRVEGSVPL